MKIINNIKSILEQLQPSIQISESYAVPKKWLVENYGYKSYQRINGVEAYSIILEASEQGVLQPIGGR